MFLFILARLPATVNARSGKSCGQVAERPPLQGIDLMFKRSDLRLLARLTSILLAALIQLFVTGDGVRADDDPWPGIHKAVFNDRPIIEDRTVQIYAPNQAEDAAIVPVSVQIAAEAATALKSMTLIIDRNPAPVAATFAFSDGYRNASAGSDRKLSPRVRVDAFSRVRAVIETVDGKLYMASKFVVGAGGCSAPASKDPDQSLAEMGRTQMKVFGDEGADPREVQIMMRHPNFTGMQMDKKTGDFTPARYVNYIEVRAGEAMLFRMEGGISISEDPNIRFTYAPSSRAVLEFSAKDTSGATFKGSTRPDPS